MTQEDLAALIPNLVLINKSGLIKGYDTTSKSLISFLPLKNETITSVSWNLPSQYDILLGTKSGKIINYSLFHQKYEYFSNLDSHLSNSSVVSCRKFNNYINIIQSCGSFVLASPDNLVQKFQLAGPISVVQYWENTVAVGGLDNNIKLFDVENSAACLFSAKNCRNDTLQLQVPVCISSISFVPDYFGKLILTGTETGERKPVLRTQWRCSRKYGKLRVGSGSHGAVITDTLTQRPIKCLNALPLKTSGACLKALIGNCIGDISVLDCRIPRSCVEWDESNSECNKQIRSMGAKSPDVPLGVKNYQTCLGAVTTLVTPDSFNSSRQIMPTNAKFLTEQYIFATSLDRYFRVYQKDTRQRIAKIPINFALIREDASFRELHRVYDVEKTEKIREGIKQTKQMYRDMRNKLSDAEMQENNAIWSQIDNKRKEKKREQFKQKNKIKIVDDETGEQIEELDLSDDDGPRRKKSKFKKM